MPTRQYPIHQVSTTQPSGGVLGDEWFNPNTNRLYKLISASGIPQWLEINLSGGTQTTSINLPQGTTAQRPSNPSTSAIRSNSELGYIEWYSSIAGMWLPIYSAPNYTLKIGRAHV